MNLQRRPKSIQNEPLGRHLVRLLRFGRVLEKDENLMHVGVAKKFFKKLAESIQTDVDHLEFGWPGGCAGQPGGREG